MSGSERVVALWRYPVKSMGGETVSALELDSRGVVGDRRLAIRTASGKLGSGKTTRRFERISGLLEYRARWIDARCVEIVCPDGRLLRSDDDGTDAALSELLGQPVQLVEEGDVSHLDAAPVHVVTAGTMAWLRERAADSDERRLRPNIVTDGSAEAPPGSVLDFPAASLRATEPTERCVMVGLAQGELAPAPDLLRAMTSDRSGCAGMYAEVARAGIVRQGDLISRA